MSKKLIALLDELKKKYPELSMDVALTKGMIEWMNDRVNWCDYSHLMDDAIFLGGYFLSIFSKLDSADALKLLKAKYGFLEELEKKLVEKCGCRKP